MKTLLAACIALCMSYTVSGQTVLPDTAKLIRWMEASLPYTGKDFKKQDSLLQLAADGAREQGNYLYLMRIQHLRGAFYLERNELVKSTAWMKNAIQTGIAHDLTADVSYRDAVSFLVLVYTTRNMVDSGLAWIIPHKQFCRQAGDDFNYSVLQTQEAINRRDQWSPAQLEALYDSAITLAAGTPSPHDNVMAIYNKSFFLKMEGKRDWSRSLETLLSLAPMLDDPALNTNAEKCWRRIPFWFRGARAAVYVEMASSFFNLQDFDNACYYMRLVADEFRRKQRHAYLPLVLGTVGEYETFRNNQAVVRHIYDTCKLLLAKSPGNGEMHIPSFFYIAGWLQEQQQQYAAAIASYKKAAEMADGEFHVAQLALLRCYGKTAAFKEGNALIPVINKQLQSSFTLCSPVLLEKELADYYQQCHAPQLATAHRLDYYRLKDSLSQAVRYVQVKQIETKFQVSEKDRLIALAKKEKELQEKQLQQQRIQVLLLAAALVLLLLTALAIYRVYLQKKQQATILAQKNSQIETLIKELHHRVKNNLQVVSSLLTLQSNRLEDETARQAMEEGRTRVDAMAMIHQRLYVDKELASVDIEDYLQNLSSSLAGSFGFDPATVSTEIRLPQSGMMDIDRAIPIGLIVNELVTNAFKHAFKGITDPRISVMLTQVDNQLTLQVADNGNGLAGEMTSPTSSFGMKLVHTLVNQLDASLHIRQENGSKFIIKLAA